MNVFPRLLVTSIAVCLVLCVFGTVRAGDEWRAVTQEELALKTPKVDPDADAEALFWEVRIDDSSSEDLAMQHYVRVKIFTDRGRENFSKVDIPFTKGMKIKDIAARVIKADGTIVEIKKEDIFEREIVKASGVKVKAKSFAIPNLEPGVIFEYRYREVISDSGAAGMRLRFQRDVPVQTLSYYYKPYNKKKPDYQSFNFNDTKFVEDQKGFWVATRINVPAMKEEPRMPPQDTVFPWMLLQTVRLNIVENSMFTITISIKDPSNPIGYWTAVGTDKSFLAKFMNKPDKEIKKAAEEITAGAATPEAKLQKLYEFCQTQIKNTTYDPTLTDEQRKKLPENKSMGDVLKHKSGSAQFVDMLFGALSNSLGYETRIAFSGNRNEMFFKPTMTNESFIHPAAIAVKVGDGWKFFNPGVAFLPSGMLIWYEEGVWALLVSEKEFLWVETPYTDVKKTMAKRNGKFKLLEDGTLEGDVTIEYDGHAALTYRLENYDDSANQREENLKAEITRRLSTGDISNIKIENVMDATKPLKESFHIRVPSYAQKTGKRLFLQPSFFEYGEPALFSSAARKFDVYFHYSWTEDDDIEIDLPAGFDLDNAEKPAPFGAGAISQYEMKIGVTSDHKTLVTHRKFFFGGGDHVLFPQTSYAQVKNLFDLLHKNDEHTITLKQIGAN
jgi:hypothetical protein